VRTLELRTLEVRTLEVRTLEVQTAEVRTVEVRTVEVRTFEVRTLEVRTLEVQTNFTEDFATGDCHHCTWESSLVMAVKVFITLAPVVIVIKLFSFTLALCQNKLERLFLKNQDSLISVNMDRRLPLELGCIRCWS
jgi:hypothetical protein